MVTIACDNNEQYSRSANVIIHGIPTPSDDSAESSVGTTVAHILSSNPWLSITEADFTAVHRLLRDRHQGASGPPRPSPIIVQFASKRVRSAVLMKRRALKEKSFSISEQLTPRRMSLLRKANDCVKAGALGGAWSRITLQPHPSRSNNPTYPTAQNPPPHITPPHPPTPTMFSCVSCDGSKVGLC